MNKRFARLPVALVAVSAGAANAAVPEAVSTAITTAGTDGATVAGVITGVMVLIWAAKILYRKFFGG